MAEKTVKIPGGVEVMQQGSTLVVRGPKGELSRDFASTKVMAEAGADAVRFRSADDRRKTLAILGTFAAHVKNMITGVTTGWECSMKIVYSHFPIKISVEGDGVVIQNFMGERSARRAATVGHAKVIAGKTDIGVSGISKEEVGQTAANIELATKVRGFDKRVFQDGCYIIGQCRPASVEASGK